MSKKLTKTNTTRKRVKIVLAVICIFLVSMASFIIYSMSQAMDQLPYVERMVNNYLFNLTNERYSNAYGLFSDEFKKYEDFVTFEKKRKEFRYGFKDYERLESDSINVNYNFGEPPMINYSGRMYYTDGEHAQVSAIFIHVNNNWEMVEVFVVAPPGRWKNN